MHSTLSLVTASIALGLFIIFTLANWLVRWLHKELANGEFMMFKNKETKISSDRPNQDHQVTDYQRPRNHDFLSRPPGHQDTFHSSVKEAQKQSTPKAIEDMLVKMVKNFSNSNRETRSVLEKSYEKATSVFNTLHANIQLYQEKVIGEGEVKKVWKKIERIINTNDLVRWGVQELALQDSTWPALSGVSIQEVHFPMQDQSSAKSPAYMPQDPSYTVSFLKISDNEIVNSQYSLRYSHIKIRCTGNEEKQDRHIFSHIFSKRSLSVRQHRCRSLCF